MTNNNLTMNKEINYSNSGFHSKKLKQYKTKWILLAGIFAHKLKMNDIESIVQDNIHSMLMSKVS